MPLTFYDESGEHNVASTLKPGATGYFIAIPPRRWWHRLLFWRRPKATTWPVQVSGNTFGNDGTYSVDFNPGR